MLEKGRPGKYKLWRSDQLVQAYEAVVKGKLSVRRAAEEFNVPRSTLHDRLSGRTQFGVTSGPCRYLSDEEEEELVVFIKNCAKLGCARSRLQVISLVQHIVDQKNLGVKVTHGWWESFRRRHGDLTLRTAERLAYIRMVSSSEAILDDYFDVLERTLVENDLQEKPCLIFNVDETGMPLDPPSLKVVASVGNKHSQATCSGDKSQITVVACCSAAGSALPPMVIFDRKILKPELTIGEVPGTMYGLSSNGWIDSELFELWFKHHFLAYAPPTRPLLLLLDGHSSHFQPTFIRSAAREQVIVFCLPPHTTHLTQPLDKGCFGPLKMYWREACQNYQAQNPHRVITRFQFSKIFSEAWQKGMTMKNIRAGFRVTGVFPLNRDALKPKEQKKCLLEDTGLKYIPMLTPRRHSDKSLTPKFSDQEFDCYQQWYENGIDDVPVERCRYQLWKSMYHPDMTVTAMSPVLTQRRLSSFSDGSESSDELHSSKCATGRLKTLYFVLCKGHYTCKHTYQNSILASVLQLCTVS